MATTVGAVANRYIVALGPIKLEILNLTGVDDTETVDCLIQRPVFAMAVINTDALGATEPTSVAISGKELTLTSADLVAAEVNVLVFGF